MVWLLTLIAALATSRLVCGTVLELNDTNFDHQTREGDYFIDIYAPWCSHCKQLEPIWQKIAQKLEGQVIVAKIDGTESPILLHRFYVQQFPTLVFLKNGQTRKYSGARNEKQLIDFALEGWKNVEPWPFYMAPNSSFGRMVGFVLGLPLHIKQTYKFLHGTLKLPQLAIVIVFLTFPVLLGKLISKLNNIKSLSKCSYEAKHQKPMQRLT